MDLAYMMVGPVVFGIVVGYWLDDVFQTRPWILLVLTLLGIMTGFWSVIKRAYYTSDMARKSELEMKNAALTVKQNRLSNQEKQD